MKGIAHFSVGIAAASCFPDAVSAAAQGNGLYLLVGGIAGLLPDTIDFRFARFLTRHDVYLTPDPLRPDARAIADGIADAMDAACRRGKPVSLKLAAMRLDRQTWQRYTVRFSVRTGKLHVTLGPLVTTGGEIVDRPRHGERGAGVADMPGGVRLAYMAETMIDAFDGPSFRFVPGDGGLSVHFIACRRVWSHSLVMAAGLGLVLSPVLDPLAGVIAALGVAAHALLDQAGYLGVSLFHPLVRSRWQGMRLASSGNGWANFICVWSCGLLTFWNLARHAHFACGMTLTQVVTMGIGLPLMARAGWRLTSAWRGQ